jgi:curved DNA-binding protein CbpA
MRPDQNHYRVLGISRRANLQQIRAAYVSLIKRFHPDSSEDKGRTQNGVHVQRIVAAYNTLKDPARRAAYDAELQQLAHRVRPAPSVTKPTRATPVPVHRPRPSPLAYVSPQRKRRKFQWKIDATALTYLLAALAAAIGIQLLVWAVGRVQHDRNEGTEAVRRVVRNLDAVPSPARLEPVARLAGTISGADADNYSGRCFAQASRSSNPTAADLCIAFDTAYLYWRESLSGAFVTDPYFQPEAMKGRDAAAYRKLDGDAAMVRIASVRAATFEALLRVSSDPDKMSGSIQPDPLSEPLPQTGQAE